MTTVQIEAPVALEHAGAGTDGYQYADSTAIVLDVDSILVADRYRKEIGDVSDLAESIKNVGLLNPITVRAWHGGYRLVAGERRLTAFKTLGLRTIDARVARDIADARDALVAERDENTARKPMLPSEATALGMAIQEMEAPAALERKAQGGRGGFATGVPGNTSFEADKWGHKTRDIAAEAVGMSPATFTRMKTLVTTVADEKQSEKVRDAARKAVAAIDNGAPVRTEYDRVRLSKEDAAARPVTAEPVKRANDKTDFHHALAALHPTVRIAFEKDGYAEYATFDSFDQAARKAGVTWKFTERQWQTRVARSADVLGRSSMGIEVALSAIAEVVDMQTITPEQATEALERLDASALNRIIKQLKEISNG
jgi:hypothetical protein